MHFPVIYVQKSLKNDQKAAKIIENNSREGSGDAPGGICAGYQNWRKLSKIDFPSMIQNGFAYDL